MFMYFDNNKLNNLYNISLLINKLFPFVSKMGIILLFCEYINPLFSSKISKFVHSNDLDNKIDL